MQSLTTAIALCLFLVFGLTACSSTEDKRDEQIESCEQVKEFEEVYKTCLEEARKVRN